jgi:S-adenosylmethionine synthetase
MSAVQHAIMHPSIEWHSLSQSAEPMNECLARLISIQHASVFDRTKIRCKFIERVIKKVFSAFGTDSGIRKTFNLTGKHDDAVGDA